MNIKAFLNTISNTAYTLPIVILYVTEGCNLKCITCSYRDAMPGELTLDEIKSLALQLKKFGLKHIVYSGGEPLLRRDFTEICRTFKKFGIKQSLLTNGLLLDKRVDEIQHYLNEIIVSIDGGKAETHNKIRGVNSFDLILKGIAKAVNSVNKKAVSIRTVLQKNNFRELPEIINMAKSAGVDRISFLSADVASDAFGRDNPIPTLPQREVHDNPTPALPTVSRLGGKGEGVTNEHVISLSKDEVNEFREIINKVIKDFTPEFFTGFISESPQKLMRLADYYGALCRLNDFPKNFCNAPMVSAVITSTGNIHPCYFIESYGNIRETGLKELINADEVKKVRSEVKNFTHPKCKTCVCTLNVSKANALFDRF